jgi:hypothetical protein
MNMLRIVIGSWFALIKRLKIILVLVNILLHFFLLLDNSILDDDIHGSNLYSENI